MKNKIEGTDYFYVKESNGRFTLYNKNLEKVDSCMKLSDCMKMAYHRQILNDDYQTIINQFFQILN